MTEKQKLDLMQTAICSAETLEDAKAYAEFILSNNEEKSNVSILAEKPQFEDGVYIVAKDGTYTGLFSESKNDNLSDADVAISYHGHMWIVAKNDLPCGETPLLKDDAKSEDDSPYYKSEIEALNDFYMQSCTKHLRDVGLAFKLKDNEFVPTLGQLVAMCWFKEELNEALKATGGEPLKNERYWSSSEYSSSTSWGVYFNYGSVGTFNKYGNGTVRPCTAF